MIRLTLPSGLEVTRSSLYRQVKNLTKEDIETIEKDPSFRILKAKLRQLLGQSLARLYNRKREERTGLSLDWWKLHDGKYQKLFSNGAIRARIYSLDFDDLIFVSERLAKKKGMKFPTPQLVCGTWAFAEVMNLPQENGDLLIAKSESGLTSVEKKSGSWIWQPGFVWDETKGEFVK